MNARDTFDRWLKRRAPGSQLDHDGIATLRRDDDTLFMIEIPAGSEVCHFCAPVGLLPDDEAGREATLLAALSLSRFGRPLGGCWLAWDDSLQMLTLCRNLPIEGADENDFNRALDHFIAAIDTARSELRPASKAQDRDEPVQFA